MPWNLPRPTRGAGRGLESIIRDFLLPLGLDTNHGYGKTPIVNSEVAKKRAALEKRLSNVQRWTASARVRCHHASVLYDRLVARKPRLMEMSSIANSMHKGWTITSGGHRSKPKKPPSMRNWRSAGNVSGVPTARAARRVRKSSAMRTNNVTSCEHWRI